MKGRDAVDQQKTRAILEMPPPGYTGSLRGTVWDDRAMISGYQGNG